MDDIKYIFFYQELVLPKSEFQIVEQSGDQITLQYRDGQACEPYVYFRPVNVEPDADKLHRYSEYHFSELLFECYEGHTPIVSREVTETDDQIIINTCYGLSHEDKRGKIEGLNFSYYEVINDDETDPVYHYRVENALGKPLYTSIPNRPLEIPVTGTLTAEVRDVPFDEVMVFL